MLPVQNKTSIQAKWKSFKWVFKKLPKSIPEVLKKAFGLYRKKPGRPLFI
jgi:hypothetical protein